MLFSLGLDDDLLVYNRILPLWFLLQDVQLVVDTGSDLVWSQVSIDVQRCVLQEIRYLLQSGFSTSSEGCAANSTAACDYNIMYGDETSTEGTLGMETVSLQDNEGKQHQLPLTFGCSNNSQTTFSKVGGILGLSLSKISFAGQMAQVTGEHFTTCLTTRDANWTNTGLLTFGDPSVDEMRLDYVPLSVPTGSSPLNPFYSVQVSGLALGTTPVFVAPSSWDHIIFDTGSTFSSISPEVFDALVASLASFGAPFKSPSYMQDGTVVCYPVPSTSQAEFDFRFPPLVFRFTGSTGPFISSGQQYVIRKDAQTACLGLIRGFPGVNIIGNIQQQNVLMRRPGFTLRSRPPRAANPARRPLMDASSPAVNFELQQFLEQEKQKAMLNELVAKLTDVCWDKCISGAPGSKFSSGEASCLSNCAQRFLETSSIILRRFESMQR
eukprot:SM000009S23520  [mRNA]  locus=s9:523846:528399:+ [translate_table: standard]